MLINCFYSFDKKEGVSPTKKRWTSQEMNIKYEEKNGKNKTRYKGVAGIRTQDLRVFQLRVLPTEPHLAEAKRWRVQYSNAVTLSFGDLGFMFGYLCVGGAIWCTRTVVM